MNDFKFVIASEYYSKITDGTHDSPKQKTTGKPLITSKHIKGRNIDFDNAYLISEEDFTKINERSQVEKWDVIISMIGEYCGFSYIERNDNIDYAVKNVGLFKTGSKIESEWLYYYLNSPIGIQFLKMTRSGSTQPYLTLNGLRELPILQTKEFKTKTKIIKILSDLDAKIELNNKINAGLEAMAKLIYDYWFVQFDFPNDDGKPYKSSGGKMVWNEELKREIPEGWEVKPLGKVLRIELGGTPSTKNEEFWDGEFPWLNSGEIANFPIINSELKITEEGIKNSATTLMPKGTCVLSITRHLRASILGVDSCANQSVVGIFESEKLKNSFIYPYLINDLPRLMTLRSGAQQPHINKGTVDDSKIIIPTENILNKYYSTADSYYNKILNNTFQIKQLSEHRDWLLPMLMNGQVKVG